MTKLSLLTQLVLELFGRTVLLTLRIIMYIHLCPASLTPSPIVSRPPPHFSLTNEELANNKQQRRENVSNGIIPKCGREALAHKTNATASNSFVGRKTTAVKLQSATFRVDTDINMKLRSNQ